MILTREDNVKVICWNYRGDGCSSSSPLSDFLVYVDMGASDAVYHQYSWNNGPLYNDVIYLGSVEDVQTAFNQKVLKTFPTNTKKVHFSPTCKYPRFKLSQTEIKRVLDPSKAEAVIITNFPSVRNYTVRNRMYNMDSQVIIGYSQSNNCYIYLDGIPNCFRGETILEAFNNALKRASKGKAINSKDDFWNVLVDYGSIPSDTKIIHNGTIVFGTKDECLTLDYIKNKYMKIVYDTELDKIINSTFSVPTEEDFKSLQSMFSSRDEAVIGMGLKLLSSYNIQERIGPVTILLCSNWYRIQNSSTINSTGFKNVLNVLGIERNDLRRDVPTVLNMVYKNCTNEDDKTLIRNRIVDHINDELSTYAYRYKSQFNKFDINVDIKVC